MALHCKGARVFPTSGVRGARRPMSRAMPPSSLPVPSPRPLSLADLLAAASTERSLAVAGLPCSRLFPFQATATWQDNRNQGSPAPAFRPGCSVSTERDRRAGLTQRQSLAPLRGLEEATSATIPFKTRVGVSDLSALRSSACALRTMKPTHAGRLRVGPTSGQRRRPRRNFTILRHAIDSANSAEKALSQP
jgi:hypothetical protein